jgi:hypothetical protein
VAASRYNNRFTVSQYFNTWASRVHINERQQTLHQVVSEYKYDAQQAAKDDRKVLLQNLLIRRSPLIIASDNVRHLVLLS